MPAMKALSGSTYTTTRRGGGVRASKQSKSNASTAGQPVTLDQKHVSPFVKLLQCFMLLGLSPLCNWRQYRLCSFGRRESNFVQQLDQQLDGKAVKQWQCGPFDALRQRQTLLQAVPGVDNAFDLAVQKTATPLRFFNDSAWSAFFEMLRPC